VTVTAAAQAPKGAQDASPTEPAGSPAARIFNLVVFIAGGVALGWMLRNHSWAELRGHLEGVGWWFLAILGVELGSLLCDAAALHAFMRPEARMIPYWRVLGAQSSGRAINVLTPGGALGEATKLTMLVSHAPRARVLSSIVLLSLSQVYMSVAVMLLGIPITLLLVDLPHGMQVTIGVGLAVILPLMIALAVLIHRGAVSTVVAALRRTRLISPDRATRWKTRLVEVDRHIRELHQNRSAGTWKGILWVLASKLIGWSGAILMLAVIGVPLNAPMILGVISIGVLVTWVSNVVPLGLGIADGSNYVLYDLLGATGPQGLVVAMVTRARTLSIAILGLGIMAAMSIADRLAAARLQRRLRTLRERAAAAAPP
jgi:uncharacterized membrane protein YbhN (UPF0104 family)